MNQVMGDGIMALFGAPDGARGSRRPRLVTPPCACSRRSSATAASCMSAGRHAAHPHRPQLRGGRRPRDPAAASPWTTRRSARARTCRPDGAARPAGRHLHDGARVARLAEGHVEATPLGEMAIKGLAGARDRVRAHGTDGRPLAARDRPGPRPDPVRGPGAGNGRASPTRSSTRPRGAWSGRGHRRRARRRQVAPDVELLRSTICAGGSCCARARRRTASARRTCPLSSYSVARSASPRATVRRRSGRGSRKP